MRCWDIKGSLLDPHPPPVIGFLHPWHFLATSVLKQSTQYTLFSWEVKRVSARGLRQVWQTKHSECHGWSW